jgi:hypothetical protein
MRRWRFLQLGVATIFAGWRFALATACSSATVRLVGRRSSASLDSRRAGYAQQPAPLAVAYLHPVMRQFGRARRASPERLIATVSPRAGCGASPIAKRTAKGRVRFTRAGYLPAPRPSMRAFFLAYSRRPSFCKRSCKRRVVKGVTHFRAALPPPPRGPDQGTGKTGSRHREDRAPHAPAPTAPVPAPCPTARFAHATSEILTLSWQPAVRAWPVAVRRGRGGTSSACPAW